MKYLCLGYFDPERMNACSPADIDAVMQGCQPHMEKLYGSARVLVDTGLALEAKCLRRMDGSVTISDGLPAHAREMIGSAFIIEAPDMAEALRLASLHPTTQLDQGEQLGWRLEVRPLHYFFAQAEPAPAKPARKAKASTKAKQGAKQGTGRSPRKGRAARGKDTTAPGEASSASGDVPLDEPDRGVGRGR